MRAWEEFLKIQEQELGEATIDKWLRPFKIVRFDACNLYLEAPDSFKAAWFEEHIRPKLASKLLSSGNKKIKVHLSVHSPADPIATLPKKSKTATTSSFGKPLSLTFDDSNPECQFNNFIPSEGNLLALKLLCETSGICPQTFQPLEKKHPLSFNPIYLAGKHGVGKSHLMMATANCLRAMGQSVVYVRAETFTEHVVDAIRSGEMQQFRKGYRYVDTLIIDDIEVLSRKNATQEEFFHTFNALHLENKQIILSSNFAPQELKFIEPRLVSRFEWGIVVPLYPLDQESIKKVLLQKSKKAHFPLSEEVTEFLLDTFTSNLKSLLRAFDALILRTHLNQGITDTATLPLSLHRVQHCIPDLIEDEEKASLTPGKIIRSVAEHYGVSMDDILSKSQSRACALPRQVAMHLCRHQLNMPFVKIGDLFSRDHSTVMTSVKQVQKDLEGKNHEISTSVGAILKRLEIDKL
jgi:chromosomal replication initiator protein